MLSGFWKTVNAMNCVKGDGYIGAKINRFRHGVSSSKAAGAGPSRLQVGWNRTAGGYATSRDGLPHRSSRAMESLRRTAAESYHRPQSGDSFQGAVAPIRSRHTGTRNSGVRRGSSLYSASNHLRKPNATNNTLTPCSDKAVREFNDIRFRRCPNARSSKSVSR